MVANSAIGASGTRHVSVDPNKGDGTFAAPPVRVISSVFAESVAPGYFNADGKLDIAASDSGGGLDVVLDTR